MDTNLDHIIKIQNALKSSGYTAYADLISNYISKAEKKGKHVVGFIGDDVVGKSTVINSILEKDILPTGILPTESEITIQYSKDTNIILDDRESIDISELQAFSTESNRLNIGIPSRFLLDNQLEFKEFHGLLQKSKLDKMEMMADVYQCDAVVLVMSAEHMFSELETIFIKNYMQYVGKDHLLLVVNKLNTLDKDEAERVLQYTDKQVSNKFPGIKWTIMDAENMHHDIVSKFISKNIKEYIPILCSSRGEADQSAVNNMLKYIQIGLEENIKVFEENRRKTEEDILRYNKKLSQEKEKDELTIKGDLLEFKKGKHKLKDNVDSLIREEFTKLSDRIIMNYKKKSNKHSWYENEMEGYWNKNISDISVKVDSFVASELEKNIQRLNDVFKNRLDIKINPIIISSGNIKGCGEITDYGQYKKYIPIGIAGGIILGFRLFRFIGAVSSLGVGFLIYNYLLTKDKEQDRNIEDKIASDVKAVSEKVERLANEEIEKTYVDIVSEFEKEAKTLLDTKYQFKEIKHTEISEQHKNILEIIDLIKGE